MYSKVGVLRFMDYLATNNNVQAAWADRTKPTDVKLDPYQKTSSRGKGGPLELAVALGNQAGKDIWINIPAMANNDYITKVAQLIKYGSDGTNPYTGPTANPVFKPLASGLHVYLEYSNETWNGDFAQYQQVLALAKAEVAAETAAGGGAAHLRQHRHHQRRLPHRTLQRPAHQTGGRHFRHRLRHGRADQNRPPHPRLAVRQRLRHRQPGPDRPRRLLQ